MTPNKVIKHSFDFIVSFLLIILLSPILIIIAMIIKITSKGPVFFIQKRIGFRNKPFNLIKFRTMSIKHDSKGYLLPNHMRINSFGRFLRSTSLDEIPELINVLKGEMSLVGPRPLLDKYLPLYSDEQLRRHEVKPGITGWAQVNGRNALSWKEKFKYDVYYVDNNDFLLDMKIMWLTIKKVVNREGIYAKEGDFVKPFDGNN